VTVPQPAPSATQAPLEAALTSDLESYLERREGPERISAISATVSLPGGSTIDVTAGTTFRNGRVAVTPRNLYQIASNTKAFTGILALELQSRGKLRLDQTLATWLPQYPQWKDVTVRQLLQMTSGIATYEASSAWARDLLANPQRDFSPQRLIGYVTGIPRKPGFVYSNTNYILAQLVLEKASGQSYETLVRSLIARAHLRQAFYYPDLYPATLLDRTVAGYFDDSTATDLAPLLGENVRDFSLSWAQAAGGIVAEPHAVALWDRQMYRGNVITPAERAELERLVSFQSGKPIDRTTPQDPRGFGLGVAQFDTKNYGRIWFYEGETLGYRLLHVYFPDDDLIVVIGLNSAPDPREDRIFDLADALYETLESYGATARVRWP